MLRRTLHVPCWLAVLGCTACLLTGALALRLSPAGAQAAGKAEKPGADEPPSLSEYPYLPTR